MTSSDASTPLPPSTISLPSTLPDPSAPPTPLPLPSAPSLPSPSPSTSEVPSDPTRTLRAALAGVLECCVCTFPFDFHSHRPRLFPCGHSLCALCLSHLITTAVNENHQHIKCPLCASKIPSGVEFPVNFVVEALMGQLIEAREKEVGGDIKKVSEGDKDGKELTKVNVNKEKGNVSDKVHEVSSSSSSSPSSSSSSSSSSHPHHPHESSHSILDRFLPFLKRTFSSEKSHAEKSHSKDSNHQNAEKNKNKNETHNKTKNNKSKNHNSDNKIAEGHQDLHTTAAAQNNSSVSNLPFSSVPDHSPLLYRLPSRCGHGQCDLAKPTRFDKTIACCFCKDKRDIDEDGYVIDKYYKDGKGVVEEMRRCNEYYCPTCRNKEPNLLGKRRKF